MNKKMADIDINPFGEHGRDEEPMDEHIPLDLISPGERSTWDPTHEQETSFRDHEGALLCRGESQRI